MPYKDKTKVRQYQKGWVRQKRGSTSQTGEGLMSLPAELIIEMEDEGPTNVPVHSVSGELVHKESQAAFLALPNETQQGILCALRDRQRKGLFDDSIDRIDRATSYLSGS